MVQTVLENKSSIQPMKGSAWTHKGVQFFSFWEGGGEEFFFFPMFPSCSRKIGDGPINMGP